MIRYARLAGRTRRLHDELVAFSPGDPRAAVRREVVVRPEGREASRDPDARPTMTGATAWDHVAFDPEHRLVLSLVPGRRTAENAAAVVADAAGRMAGRAPRLVTTDEHGPYEQAVLDAFGVDVTPPRTGKPGRPRKARREPHPDLTYATVRKTRARGRVVSVVTTLVFGTAATLAAALRRSACSTRVNTSFLERQNGTDRHRNARKVRKTYRFSKDGPTHDAVGHFAAYGYNFCWPVRTLSERGTDGRRRPRTPAMAAGLADHVWPLAEWLARPAVRRAA